jgi:hypothetical protein
MPRIHPRLTAITLCLPFLILPIACKHDRGAGVAKPSTQAAADPRPSISPIDYTRTGGIAGTEDHIHILPSGEIQTRGRMLGTAHGQLTNDQLRDLASLLENWDTLAAHYPSPPGTADAYEIMIQYGNKKVIASEAADHLPAQFTKVRQTLESLAEHLSAHE